MSRLENKVSQRLFELSFDNIMLLSNMESGGGLSNVINGLEKESYSLIIKESGDKTRNIKYSLSFIGYEKEDIKGYILEDIEVFDLDRDDMTLSFSIFLESKFSSVDRIDTYNTFQSHLRSALEKLDFFTYTQELFDEIEGKELTMVVKQKNGAVFIPMVDKIEAYKALFRRIDGKNKKNNNNSQIDYVYLFFNDRSKLTKIGNSKNPEFREKTLQGQEPIVEIIAKWEAPKRVERELHKIFKEKRIRGEWFQLTTEDYIFIAEYMIAYKQQI